MSPDSSVDVDPKSSEQQLPATSASTFATEYLTWAEKQFSYADGNINEYNVVRNLFSGSAAAVHAAFEQAAQKTSVPFFSTTTGKFIDFTASNAKALKRLSICRCSGWCNLRSRGLLQEYCDQLI